MTQVLSVISGKGGVGKTLLTAALGIQLSRMGKKVLLIDGDMGLRNLDLILGVENECFYNIWDLAQVAQRYEINTGYPMPKATFMGGINLNF